MAVILGVVPVEAAVETSTIVHDTRSELERAATLPVIRALENKDIRGAARAYRSRSTHIARPLIRRAQHDRVLALRLAWMFICVGDDHRAAQLYELLGRDEEAAILYARADQYRINDNL